MVCVCVRRKFLEDARRFFSILVKENACNLKYENMTLKIVFVNQ